jgi:hypothetical protein
MCYISSVINIFLMVLLERKQNGIYSKENLIILIFLFSFVLFWFFETGSHYVAQLSLKLMILLAQPPKCWNYRHVLPEPVYFLCI